MYFYQKIVVFFSIQSKKLVFLFMFGHFCNSVQLRQKNAKMNLLYDTSELPVEMCTVRKTRRQRVFM
jgi:hypothetical protein